MCPWLHKKPIPRDLTPHHPTTLAAELRAHTHMPNIFSGIEVMSRPPDGIFWTLMVSVGLLQNSKFLLNSNEQDISNRQQACNTTQITQLAINKKQAKTGLGFSLGF
jgi:hypothetical protein